MQSTAVMNTVRTFRHKTDYCGRWRTTSQHLRSQGCYDWMADQLVNLSPRKILDIGCGSGNGLLALIAHFDPTTIISLEENVDCIDTTVRALVADGKKPLAHSRLSYEPDPEEKYHLQCLDDPVELDSAVSVIQSDILCEDQILNEAMERKAPFDAVTVWLMGTDIIMLRKLGLKPAEYRLQVQLRIYKLANLLLRPGGWIHFVDRSRYPLTEDQKHDMLQFHKELIQPTKLKLLSFANRSYEEAGQEGIPMVGTLGAIGNQSVLSLNSIISCLADEGRISEP